MLGHFCIMQLINTLDMWISVVGAYNSLCTEMGSVDQTFVDFLVSLTKHSWGNSWMFAGMMRSARHFLRWLA